MDLAEFDFDFSTGSRASASRSMPTPPEVKSLPEAEKLRMSEAVLRSLGVSSWRTNGKGEMVHSCPIPGQHANGDRRPSASFSYRNLAFHCYGCGSRGGLLWFIATCRESTAEEALKWVQGETGVGGEGFDIESLLNIIAAYEAKPETKVLQRYDPKVLDPWLSWTTPHFYLTDPISEGGRGIPAETCWHFEVGYAPEYRLRDYATDQIITQERVVIPLYWRGALRGWQARALNPGDEPKYHNSPDFPRDIAAFNHTDRRDAVVVESPMSVLRHHHHMPEMISMYGAEVSPEQMRLLKRYDRVTLWLDNDKSGWDSTSRILEELPAHTDVRVVDSDYDADPADLPDSLVKSLVQGALPWPIWSKPDRLRPKEMIPWSS